LLIPVSSFNLQLRISFALTATQKVTGWGVTIDGSLIFEEYLLNYNAALAAADVEVTGGYCRKLDIYCDGRNGPNFGKINFKLDGPVAEDRHF
jgi:hypothetical protein